MALLILVAMLTPALAFPNAQPVANVSIQAQQSQTSSSGTIAITAAPVIEGSIAWQTTGSPDVFPTEIDNSMVCTTYGEWSTARGPCFAWCLNTACDDLGSSIAATCSPQWDAYITASQDWLQEHPASMITDIVTITNSSLEGLYTSTSTDSAETWTARDFTLGGTLTVDFYNPVYVFGQATATSTHYSTTASYTVQSFWVNSENGITATVSQSPFPTPPPFCNITSVQADLFGPDDCTEYINDCKINGGTVQLFYWPEQTVSPGSMSARAVNGSFATVPASNAVVTVSGITMTSPSVYISLAKIYATNYCGQLLGDDHAGTVLTMDPQAISSVAPQGPFNIAGTPAYSFNYADLQGIVPAQAWYNANQCWNTPCYTITNDEYRPYLSIPPEIYALDSRWSTCDTGFEGLYDPPVALTQGVAMAVPTMPPLMNNFVAPQQTSSLVPPSAPTLSIAQPTSQPLPDASSAPETPAGMGTYQYTSPSSTNGLYAQTADSPSSQNSAFNPVSGQSQPVEISHQTTSAGPLSHSVSRGIGDIIAGAIGMSHEPGSPSSAVAAITIGTQTYTRQTATRSGDDYFVIAGQTLVANGAITAAGTTIALAASGSAVVINGHSRQLEVPSPTSEVFVVGDHTFTRASSDLLIASETIAPGQPVTFSNIRFVYDPQNDVLVVDGRTHTIAAATPMPGVTTPSGNQHIEIMTIGPETYSRVGGPSAGFTIDGKVLLPGHTIISNGTTISLPISDGIVMVDDTTEAIQTVTQSVHAFSNSTSVGRNTTRTTQYSFTLSTTSAFSSPTTTSAAALLTSSYRWGPISAAFFLMLWQGFG